MNSTRRAEHAHRIHAHCIKDNGDGTLTIWCCSLAPEAIVYINDNEWKCSCCIKDRLRASAEVAKVVIQKGIVVPEL